MKDSDGARQILEEHLKKGNYRITRERFEVLDAVMKTDGHFDADGLFLDLKKSGSKVSRATVYKTLEILGECDLVFKTRLKDQGARFEKAYGRAHHDHLICIRCGKIIEFVSPKIEKEQLDIARKFKFRLVCHSLQAFGLCPSCSHKAL